MTKLKIILGISLILIVICSIIFYVVQKFSNRLGLSKLVILGGLFGLFVIGIIVGFLCTKSTIQALTVDLFYCLIVFSFILFLILLIDQILSKFIDFKFYRTIGIGILIFGIGAFFAFHTKITELDIKSDKITNDTTILFVSDIHSTALFPKYFIKKLKNNISEINPDFVLIGGDLLNNGNEDEAKNYGILSGIQTPIFAVNGNHDYGNGKSVKKYSPIKILDNKNISVGEISIVGIDDLGWFGDFGEIIDLAIEDNEFHENQFKILLTHQPINLEKIENYDFDLELAGHTHDGQIFLLKPIIAKVNDYRVGKYERDGKIAFISQGLGFRGLPFRLGTQSEIVVINLKNK